MPNYRLVYFNVKGRAEPIRWILSYTEQQFQDERFDRQKEWEKKKKELQYGKVPILYIDGSPLSDSMAICRYLGQINNLVSSDPWQNAIGEEVAGAVHDLVPHAAKILYAKLSGNLKEADDLLKEFKDNVLPFALNAVEGRLKNKKWLCGDKITWTDLFVGCYLSALNDQYGFAFEPFPAIRGHIEGVLGLPQIKKWIQERPHTVL